MFGVYISFYVCDAYEFAIICPDSRWFWLMSRFVSSLIFPLTWSRHSSSVWFSKIQSLRILHIHCSETCVLNMLFRTFEFWVSGLRVWGWRLEVTIPCQPPTKLEDKEKTPAPATWLQGEVSQRVLNPKRLRFVWLQIMGISINIWYSRYIWVKATYLFLLGMGNAHGLPVGVDYVTDFVVWRSFIRLKPTWGESFYTIGTYCYKKFLWEFSLERNIQDPFLPGRITGWLGHP